MVETRGAFVLSKVILKKLDDNWVPPEEVFINEQVPNTGYFGGGGAVGNYSTMDKVTYSSDTTAAVPGANLSVARQQLAATGSSVAGYFGGGTPGTFSTMDKVTYASDTTAAVPGAALSVARGYLSATGNLTSGYFGGGSVGPSSNYSTMDKITYASDTTAAVPGAFLSIARGGPGSTGNSIAGYFGGGSDIPGGLLYSTMDKVTYSTDTRSTVPGAALSAARYRLAAAGNQISGYFGGGTPGTFSTMDKVTYSTDTTAAVPGAALSIARSTLAATGNSTSGYFGGGTDGSVRSTMDKVTYSSDTTAAVPGAALSVARIGLAASSLRANGLPSLPLPNLTKSRNFISQGSSFNSGYFGGGAPNYSTMDKVTYSTDTTVRIPGANLSQARGYLAATGSSIAGYFAGGNSNSPIGSYSIVDKVTYSTDTTAVLPSAGFLSSNTNGAAATGNSTAGYFGGGNPGPDVSVVTMNKVTYSTDTRTTVPGAALSAARSALAATGNSTSGYFGGGSGPSFSTMDKVSYSTDTSVRIPGGNLSQARGYLAATGNSTSGYFGGGDGPFSTMDKVIYSTDTRSTVATGALSLARSYLAATGNQSAGHFGGGTVTTMEKLDYSTEVTSRTPGASLSVARGGLAASSSTANALNQQDITLTPQALQGNTGYFGGGNGPGSPGLHSTMDKVTYSTDTTAALPSGANLSFARYHLAATGSSVAGYFGGGENPGSSFHTTMDKVTYSSDTTAAVPGAALSAARGYLAATGNSTAGYFGGGFSLPAPGVRSTMDKVTYSSDTTAAVPGAALSLNVGLLYLAATGNSIAGYFGGGGSPGGAYSSVSKVTYSSDTTAATPGANLSIARTYLAATGSSTVGYFGGGDITPSPTPTPPLYSTMDKITYSTDTTAAVPGANLSVAREQVAATGNSTAGYFGGGVVNPSSNYSTMDKVTYSTDTRSVTPGGLSVARYGLAASSSTANAVRGTTPQVPIV